MKDNSKYIAIVLAILAVIVVFISLITNKGKKIEEENEALILTNYSEFYTVNSCLYRVITYVASNDKESLILILNDNYEKENKINSENVLDLFAEINESSTFISENMYYAKLNESLTKYYVKGHIEQNILTENETIKKKENKSVYFIVYLDSSNNVFSIEPYDGKIFEKGDVDEK